MSSRTNIGKFWTTTLVVFSIFIALRVALGAIAEPPGFAQYPGVPLGERPPEKKTNPWREAAWWLLHPGVGNSALYSMIVQPNIVDGLYHCYQRIVFRDVPTWDKSLLFPQYPGSALKSCDVSIFGDGKGWGDAQMASADRRKKIAAYYLNSLSQSGWQFDNSWDERGDVSEIVWQRPGWEINLRFGSTDASGNTTFTLRQCRIKQMSWRLKAAPMNQ